MKLKDKEVSSMLNNIKEMRLQKGFSQQEFAEKLSISITHLNKIERGNREPSLKLAVRMASLLECRIEELFFCDKS